MAVIRFDPIWVANVNLLNNDYSYEYPLLYEGGNNPYVAFDMEEINRIMNTFNVNQKRFAIETNFTPTYLRLPLHYSVEPPSENHYVSSETTSGTAFGVWEGDYYKVDLDGSLALAGFSGPIFINFQEAINAGAQGFMIDPGSPGEIYKVIIELDGDFDNPRPSPTTPTGGSTLNRNETIRFAWNHNSNFNQVIYELRYRVTGSSNWEVVQADSSNQYFDLPAGTLMTDEYEWQVRTTSEYGFISPWSLTQVFNTAETTPSPIFIEPINESVIEISDLHVEWDSVDQYQYEFELLDDNNNVIWSDARISTSQELSIDNILENGQSYRLRLRVNQDGNFFSPWVQITINVDYTQPASPTLEITPNGDESNLRIFIDNPTPTGTEPQAVNQELFKREPGGSWIKLADLLPNSEYIDYAVASDQTYEYRVTVHGNNDTSTRSNVFSGSVTVDYTVINLANDPGLFIKLEIVRDRSGATNLNATKKQFAGRRFPVTEFGETLENDVDIECLVTPNEYQFLIDLFKRQETLIYRDSRGRKMYATIASFSFNDEYKQYVSISTSFSQVDYKEGID